MFKLDILSLHWIDESADNPDDLCLHGNVVTKVGEEIFEYYATVSAAALVLLRTLTENHAVGTDNQILPCCGHFMIANENLDSVEICGCPNGMDWNVTHEANEDTNQIRIVTQNGNEVFIEFADYQKEVFEFADKVEEFYKKCAPKKMPDDNFEKNGYIAFWAEWRRRRYS